MSRNRIELAPGATAAAIDDVENRSRVAAARCRWPARGGGYDNRGVGFGTFGGPDASKDMPCGMFVAPGKAGNKVRQLLNPDQGPDPSRWRRAAPAAGILLLPFLLCGRVALGAEGQPVKCAPGDDACEAAAARRALGLRQYMRALSPVAEARATRQQQEKRRRQTAQSSLLRFETKVEVSAPPLDLNALGASWWAHWNGLPDLGPPTTAAPTHAEMLAHMSGTLPHDMPQGANFVPLVLSAVQALQKKLIHERMPPAEEEPR
jgi:hypothetical protein